MSLLTEINKQYRDIGILKANKQSYIWYKTARDDKNDMTVTKLPKEKGYLEPGKIHIFTYNPLGKQSLDYYDKKPVVISLGTVKTKSGKIYDVGINLNFIPFPYKWYLLNVIREMYSEFYTAQTTGRHAGNALTQNRIKYKYTVLKKLLKKYNMEFAIRRYIPSRKSRVYVCSYETWLNVSFLSIENFEKITYDDMIKKYKESK